MKDYDEAIWMGTKFGCILSFAILVVVLAVLGLGYYIAILT